MNMKHISNMFGPQRSVFGGERFSQVTSKKGDFSGNHAIYKLNYSLAQLVVCGGFLNHQSACLC